MSTEDLEKPEDFLIELVCNARWIADYCCNELSPETKASYGKDVQVCEEMLNSLRKPLGHIEMVSELPMQCVQCLCRGVAYLLCAEGMLTNQVPPTMHQYLRQSQDRRADKAYETQFLVVRWFLSIELISRDELLRVLHGEMDGLGGNSSLNEEELTTEALSSMMAKALADPDPFYIGAHVVLTRALMMRHCASIVSIDDILGHAALLAPPDVSMEAEPHTLEDALLFWLRTAMALVDPSHQTSSNSSAAEAGGNTASPHLRAAFELSHVDDLYLHTNDGRVLSLVIQQYRPDLLDSTKIHFYNPLSVWNRQDNWVNIIEACEAQFLFVGVYPDEVVAHGFTRLQYHVIRIILEVFAVMAMDSEKTFDSMCEALDTDTTFVQIRQSLGGYVSLHSPPATDKVVDMLNQPPMSAREQQEKSREVEHSEFNTPAEGNTPADKPGGAPSVVVASSKPPDQEYQLIQPGPALEDSSEYNVILTGMFLQGVSMPLHTENEAAPSAASESPQQKQKGAVDQSVSGVDQSANDTTGFEIHDVRASDGAAAFRQSGMTNLTEGDGDDEVNIESPSQQGGRTDATDTSSATFTQPTTNGGGDESIMYQSEMLDTGSDPDLSYAVDPAMRLFQSQITEGTPASSTGDSPAAVAGGGPVRVGRNVVQAATSDPTRSISPDVSASRDRRVMNAVGQRAQPTNPLLASMAHFQSQKPRDRENNKLTSSVVLQGSMDAQGIDELFAELAALGDSSKTTLVGSPQDTERENAQLRSMLNKQQQQIGVLVERMKKQVKQQELAAIMQYMRTQNKTKAAAAAAANKKVSPGETAVVSTATSTRGSFAARQLTPLSPNQVREQGPPRTSQPVEFKQKQQAVPPPAAQRQRSEDVSPTLTEATQVAPSTGARPPTQTNKPPVVAHETKQEAKRSASPTLQENAPPVEEAENKKGGNVFDISIGGLGKGKKTDGLTAPQLQKLKERHEERRVQQRQKVAGAGQVGILPSISRRNNKQVINNALRYACLVGPINKRALDNALTVVEQEEGHHLVILLKDEFNHAFRGAYAEREDRLVRVFGAGPTHLLIPQAPGPSPVPGAAPVKFFRYDTGPKAFANFNGQMWDGNVDAIAYCGGKVPKNTGL